MSIVVDKTAPPVLVATFFVRDALFALEASVVQEVIRMTNLNVVPHAPDEVAGIVNLRGRIVTVIDAAFRLGFGRTEPGSGCRIFILEDHNEHIGLLVDRVGDVIEIESGRCEPPPANVLDVQKRFFKGVFRVGSRIVSLLDAGLLLETNA